MSELVFENLNLKKLTIQELLANTIRRFPESDSLGFYNQKPYSFAELEQIIHVLQSSLTLSGIKKGDKVGLVGENSVNWAIAYLALTTMGAIAVPILPDFPEEDIENILSHSESIMLFSGRHLLEKLNAEKCPGVKEVVLLDGDEVETGFNYSSFRDYLEFGKKAADKFINPGVEEDDLAVIIYTSGTTGHSKGVMLTHRNIVHNVLATNEYVDFTNEDKFISFLPISHAIESTIGFLLGLANGAAVYFVGKPPTPTVLEEVCAIVKPSCMVWVPLIVEKIYKKRVKKLLEKNAMMKSLAKSEIARKAIYRKAVKKLLNFLGGNIKVVALGGAALSREVEEFLKEGEFPYVFGYGLTETAPLVTGERISETRVGSPGYPIKYVEVNIGNEDETTGIGEIYVRGPNVMKGYYKNPELTAEVLSEDGWFKTGDKGYMDEDGYLYIKGRSKNMFLGSNGENIYPEVIEEKLNTLLEVQETVVIENSGDIEALIYLDMDHIGNKLEGKDEHEKNSIITQILEEIRRQANDKLPDFSRIKRCFFHSEPFMKTATQKIKRYLYYQNPIRKQNL